MKTLDSIIMQRQSTRFFTDDVPAKELIEQIVEAGRLAPYAGIVQKRRESIRHFIVLSRTTPIMKPIMALVEESRLEIVDEAHAAQMAERWPEMVKVLDMLYRKSADDMAAAPWLIIIAEQAGVPQREQVCLGHVMENMWLKATELELGAKPSSGIADIKDKAALCRLLGLDSKEDYAFDALSVGYPKTPLAKRDGERKPLPSLRWFE